MPKMVNRGNGLFIESFRTPEERKRVKEREEVERLAAENQELKEQLNRIELLLTKLLSPVSEDPVEEVPETEETENSEETGGEEGESAE